VSTIGAPPVKKERTHLALDQDMILDRDREAVEGADHGSRFGKMLIKLSCALEGGFEEDFGETIGQVLGCSGCLAESDCDFGGGEAGGCYIFENGGRIEGDDLFFAGREDREREVSNIEL
jgi:hypothetical protein